MKYTEKELIEMGLKYHHRACCRGYTSVRSIGNCQPYDGKFGKGITRAMGKHRNSTQYTAFEYWIKA